MTLQLPTEIEKFIDDQVKAGKYASAQAVVCAGLQLLRANQSGEFGPGEWDRLLAEAEATEEMDFDHVVAKRREERTRAGK